MKSGLRQIFLGNLEFIQGVTEVVCHTLDLGTTGHHKTNYCLSQIFKKQIIFPKQNTRYLLLNNLQSYDHKLQLSNVLGTYRSRGKFQVFC